MTRGLEGKVAVITGAGAGMGRAHARLMAERGAKVAVQDIRPDAAAETVRLIRADGGEADFLAGDVADKAHILELVRMAESRFGRIDILVNNAGVPGELGTTETTTEAGFDRTYAVNVKGMVFATQAVVPGMKARRSGKIVNISSRWAQVGSDFGIDYCGTKAAVLGLTKAWAKELAPWRICVNAVAPGGVWTDMALQERGTPEEIREVEKSVPLGRWAQPRELAFAVAFLASPEADFITGQVIAANGGATIVGF
ncbi:MAG: glucose 1-dehydrogenase [Alphaproteobacteria bacterium]